MILKTKKVTLTYEDFFRIAMKNKLTKDWWVIGLASIFLGASIFFAKYWIMILYVIGATLYFGFWALQFWGVRYLEQMAVLFSPTNYDISPTNIMAKISPTTGYQIEWKMIKDFQTLNKAYILNISLAQFVYLPFKAFASTSEQNIFEKILLSKVRKRSNVITKIVDLYAKIRRK